ncbi:MAG TPA: hypothetical protein VM938_11680 [Acidimicrobiales bacterium]|nr:hypothetical protein [Acidimicrobiales bacterium]
MQSNRIKVLATLGVLSAAAAGLGGIGTFAGFTAQVKNADNLFSNGTLVLSSTKTGGSACLSTGGGTTDTNSNTSCEALFNATVQKPGDSATQTVTVKNEGSLAATAFKVFSAACTNADNAESYHGTGNPCSKVQLYVQQYSDSGFTTPSACVYGGTTTANTCDFSDAAKTLAAFQTSYSSSSNGLAIGSGLDAGGSTYFKVGVKLPADADNTFQGRKATTDLTWYLA